MACFIKCSGCLKRCRANLADFINNAPYFDYSDKKIIYLVSITYAKTFVWMRQKNGKAVFCLQVFL